MPLRRFTQAPESFRFPPSSYFHIEPATSLVLARRVIMCIRERLLEYDPERWRGVEITYGSHWNRMNGKVDVATCIQIHEALEKEFKIDILDQRVLITDIQTACAIVSGEEIVQ